MAEKELKLPADQSEQLLVKSEGQTNPEYGTKPEERTLRQLFEYGVINLDKMSGPTSHEVVA